MIHSSRVSLLLVEDDKELAEILAHRAKLEGFRVYYAHDGVEGLTLALREKPDAIVTDIMLPEADGLSMVAELRKHPWGKHVPVIVLTNYNDLRYIAQAISCNVYEFVVKAQCEPHQIVAKVKQAIAERNCPD